MSYLLHTLFCFHFGAVFEYHRHIFLALYYNFLHWTAPNGIVKFCDNAFLVFQDCDESAHLFIPCFIVRNCGADFIVLCFQSAIAFRQGIVVCFGLCPCQHNGTYTRNVYPATPTKKPAQILRFAESKKEPLSRKILGKAARNALGKGTGPSNLPKSILASFCHASKNGRKKARKSLKLLDFSRRYLFWFSLMVDLKRLELSTSRMRTERSPE